MKSVLTIFIILPWILCSTLRGQATSKYKDVLVSNDIIWALTDDGNVRLFDAATGSRIDKNVHSDSDIILITKDRNENIVIANKKRQVKKYDRNANTWVEVGEYDAEPFGILVDSKGAYFSVTAGGIQELATKKNYFNKKPFNTFVIVREHWGKPYCFYIDKNDIIWLGFGYGEWGGNLFAFRTDERRFLDLSQSGFQIEYNPIKSIFEDSTSLYVSAGLAHFRTRGTIMKVDDLKASIVLHSEDAWSKPTGKDSVKRMRAGEYIGPATYSPFNNSIYFYSQNGIFRGEKTKDLSNIDNWEIVVSPRLTWRIGQPDAVGSPMNVLKLCVIDRSRIVFLSQNDGIGFFDGEKLVML